MKCAEKQRKTGKVLVGKIWGKVHLEDEGKDGKVHINVD